MRTFKRHQPHSLQFALFLAVVGALLLPAALAPRANAEVDANFSWSGVLNSDWNNSSNWGGGPPGPGDTAVFNQAFLNQPNLTTGVTVGTLHMTTGVVQNVTLSSNGGTLSLTALSILGTGILVDNANAATLTITANVAINNSQAWTNNSGNLFTVSGAVDLADNALTVNGTGNTLISGNVLGMGGSTLTKDGSGTLTLTVANTYDDGTTVNGGTLLVNNAAGSGTGMGAVTVNSGGTLGGTGIISGSITVNAGGTLAPGNGGNNTAILQTGAALTLASTSNFRIDINGTTAGTGYDRIQVNAGAVNITGSNLVVTVGTSVAVGQTFLILDKVAAGAITGTFAGIPQGGTVVGSDGTIFSVSYTGGTGGNDIVLTALTPEPSTWLGGTLAIAGLAFSQRRRLRKLIARRCAVGS